MLQRKEYPLQPASVDAVSEEIVRFLTEAKVSRNIIVQNRIFAEETLLSWLDNNVSETFRLVMGYRFRKPVISLEASGMPFSVFEQTDENGSVLINNLLNSIGCYPSYSYVNGKNIVQLTFPEKEKNKLVQILIAIALAVAVGLAFSFLPEGISKTFLSDIIDPLYSAAFRVLGFISGPLIFLSVMWGIYGIGDASTLNLVGRRMVFRFLLIIFVIAAASCITFPIFRLEMSSATGGSSSFKAIFEMILDIIPPNIAEPFTSGNTLHIIFCAVIFGIAMLYLGKRISTLADLVDQINSVVQFLMTVIGSLMPYFIFLVVLRLMMSGTISVFSSVWQLFMIFTATVLVMCGVFTAVVCIKQRVSPLIILKKSIPTFLITITTASSAAAFPCCSETCEKKFGIDNSLCAFGIPMGMVIFKTAGTVYYVFISFFFAKQFGVAVSPAWFVSAAFLSAMLAIATPPIPGGGVAAYIMLFSRLGIPDEAIAVVISIEIIFDFVLTAANMYNLPLSLIGIASEMGKLNPETLRNELN